jgi:hypothetical protein
MKKREREHQSTLNLRAYHGAASTVAHPTTPEQYRTPEFHRGPSKSLWKRESRLHILTIPETLQERVSKSHVQRSLVVMWDLPNSQLAITPFYKRGCQDKYLSYDGKTTRSWSCRPAPPMERDSLSYPSPRIHIAFATTPFVSQRRQAERLCIANHGSI